MKFRNILLTTFAASAFVIGTTSCSDSFLDEKMYSSYGPEVSDVNAKLVGLHRQYAAIYASLHPFAFATFATYWATLSLFSAFTYSCSSRQTSLSSLFRRP